MLLYWLDLKSNELLDTKIVWTWDEGLVVSNVPRMAREPVEIIAAIVKEKTGLTLADDRFRFVQKRQLCTGGSTAILFAASLTEEELVCCPFVTLREILLTYHGQWASIGMVLEGIASHSGPSDEG